jgi:hypothetical protein
MRRCEANRARASMREGLEAEAGYARGMLGRTAIVVIPTVAVAVTALVLLGPGALRPAVGVRLRGAPSAGARIIALRLEALTSLYDVDEVTALDGIHVDAMAGGARVGQWSGDADKDGIAEVQLESPAPIQGPLQVIVTRAGVLLAHGAIPLGPAAPIAPARGFVPGSARGDLGIQVEASRGALAAPFPDTVSFQVSELLGGAPAQVDLELSVLGADLFKPGSATTGAAAEAMPYRLTTDNHGAARVVIKPLTHDVTLTITARTLEKTGHWEGVLPVIPGAAWIEPGTGIGPFVVVSPAPHAFAYLSFWSDTERVGGASLPLAKDPDGFYRARVTPPLSPQVKTAYVSIAGDPLERGAGTVVWPLRPAEGTAVVRPLELVIDGIPDARALEKARAWSARRAGLAVVVAAALAEILLLLYRSRASQQQLEAHFLDGEPADSPDRPGLLRAAREHMLLRALVGVAVIALAFAIIGALTTLRMR